MSETQTAPRRTRKSRPGVPAGSNEFGDMVGQGWAFLADLRDALLSGHDDVEANDRYPLWRGVPEI